MLRRGGITLFLKFLTAAFVMAMALFYITIRERFYRLRIDNRVSDRFLLEKAVPQGGGGAKNKVFSSTSLRSKKCALMKIPNPVSRFK